VELPGIEAGLLPGKTHSEMLFRYVLFRFSRARYMRFRFRVLMAQESDQTIKGKGCTLIPRAILVSPSQLATVCALEHAWLD
jgi:hypothetical protein